MRVNRALAAGGVVAVALVVGAASGASVPGSTRTAPAPAARKAPVAAAAHHGPAPVVRHTAFRVPGVGSRGIEIAALNAVVERYCRGCHNDKNMRGNVSLEGFAIDSAPNDVEVAEKMIRKLRTAMMPPPTSRRPGGDTLLALVETLEQTIDAASKPMAGVRTFQRLNRPEYEAAVRDLLGVTVDAADYLPLDTKSANFDNVADVQMLSPTLLEAYLNAAASVTRMALGDKSAPPIPVTYRISPFVSQHPWDHVDGAPFGTRGGIVETHTFPADGKYVFRVNVGGGIGTKFEDIDISVDGQQVALLKYDKGVEPTFASADAPQGADYIRTVPVEVKAGQRRVSASFVRLTDGPYEDLIKPHEWSMASNGNASAGTTAPPHIVELSVIGPEKAEGISESPSRAKILTCYPKTPAAAEPCARQVLTQLATRAYRRPATPRDVNALMKFYRDGARQDGFEGGMRESLQAVLSSPYFIFRFETLPARVADGKDYTISDLDLASRLSFFIWGSIPDDELLNVAAAGKLSNKAVLNAQVKRMLADPKAAALAPRFAAQWLRLQDVEKVHPDAYFFPDFDQQLADAMKTETEMFFTDVVRNDRSVLELFTADWTYVNERLARHYGIPGVAGREFRRVNYPDSTRRGILGQGSILVQTSLANRTSPVLRGKWVMEVILNAPPPAPPPNVPTLEETGEGKDGKVLTTRERMEIHRKNPTCNACHQYIDPIGLSLDNFDVTGKWRYRENGAELDTKGKMYDGRMVSSASELLASLMTRPIPIVRAFTENLMTYATGRRVEPVDEPVVRAIAAEAEKNGYKFSSFITGVVNSPQFRRRTADVAADDAGPAKHQY